MSTRACVCDEPALLDPPSGLSLPPFTLPRLVRPEGNARCPVHVECPVRCGALHEPETLEEFRTALRHERDAHARYDS